MREPNEKRQLLLTDTERELVAAIDSRIGGIVQITLSLIPEFISNPAEAVDYQPSIQEAMVDLRSVIEKSRLVLPQLEVYPKPQFRVLAQLAGECLTRFEEMQTILEAMNSAMVESTTGAVVDQASLALHFKRFSDLYKEAKPIMMQISEDPVYILYRKSISVEARNQQTGLK